MGMKIARTDRFDEEARRYGLRFTCEDCGMFDAARERCRHGWPVEAHRLSRYLAPPEPGSEVIFCKEFEVR